MFKKSCVQLFGAWVSFLSSMPQEWFPHGCGYISLRYPKTHDSPVPHEIWPWTPPPTFFRTTTDLLALVERFIGVGAIVLLFLVPTKNTWPTSLLGNLATDHSHTFENQHRLGGKVGLCLPLLASSAVCNWTAPRGCAGKKNATPNSLRSLWWTERTDEHCKDGIQLHSTCHMFGFSQACPRIIWADDCRELCYPK